MATAAAALRLLRRRAAAPASPMLRSLFTRPHSKAAAASLPTESRLHAAPSLAQPYLLRRYSSKGFDGSAGAGYTLILRMNQGTDSTTADDNIPRLVKQFKVIGKLELLSGDLIEQCVKARKAVVPAWKLLVCYVMILTKLLLCGRKGGMTFSDLLLCTEIVLIALLQATASLKESPLDLTLRES